MPTPQKSKWNFALSGLNDFGHNGAWVPAQLWLLTAHLRHQREAMDGNVTMQDKLGCSQTARGGRCGGEEGIGNGGGGSASNPGQSNSHWLRKIASPRATLHDFIVQVPPRLTLEAERGVVPSWRERAAAHHVRNGQGNARSRSDGRDGRDSVLGMWRGRSGRRGAVARDQTH